MVSSLEFYSSSWKVALTTGKRVQLRLAHFSSTHAASRMPMVQYSIYRGSLRTMHSIISAQVWKFVDVDGQDWSRLTYRPPDSKPNIDIDWLLRLPRQCAVPAVLAKGQPFGLLGKGSGMLQGQC